MSSTAGNREIQLIEKHVPDARILGVVRERCGLLIDLPRGDSAAAENVQQYERELLKAGVREWIRDVEHNRLKARVYWPTNRWRNTAIGGLVSLLTVFTAVALLSNDIRATQTIRSWITPLQ